MTRRKRCLRLPGSGCGTSRSRTPTCSTPGTPIRPRPASSTISVGTPNPTDREALAKGPLRNERNGQLIVERVADGQPIGVVGFHAVGLRTEPRVEGLEHRDRAAPRGARAGLRERGAGPLRGLPVRDDRGQPGRGPDRRRQRRRATVAREGRVRARGDDPRRAVPGGRATTTSWPIRSCATKASACRPSPGDRAGSDDPPRGHPDPGRACVRSRPRPPRLRRPRHAARGGRMGRPRGDLGPAP